MEKKDALEAKSTLSSKLDTTYSGKKLGIWISFGISVLTLLLSLPFMKWIYVVNSANLYQTLGVAEDKKEQFILDMQHRMVLQSFVVLKTLKEL